MSKECPGVLELAPKLADAKEVEQPLVPLTSLTIAGYSLSRAMWNPCVTELLRDVVCDRLHHARVRKNEALD
jgi:hypothetical protein